MTSERATVLHATWLAAELWGLGDVISAEGLADAAFRFAGEVRDRGDRAGLEHDSRRGGGGLK